MTKQTSEAEKASQKFPASISVAGALIFLLMLTAMALPEYFRYRLRVKQLEFSQQQAMQQAAASSASPSATSQTVPSSGQTQQVSAGATAESASLFESYARFITLLVGLVSVLGFFLGFFIRRSIREHEEDIDKKLAKSVEGWKDEQTAIKQSYKEQSEKLDSKIREVDALKEGVSDLERRLKDRLKELNESEALYKRGGPEVLPSTADVAKEVDETLEVESVREANGEPKQSNE